MSEQNTGVGDEGEQDKLAQKKLILKMPVRVSALTSQGTFYLRHFRGSDASMFDRILQWDLQEPRQAYAAIGNLVLQKLTCLQAKGEATTISDESFANLTELDKEELAKAAAKASDLSLETDMVPIEALGLASYTYSEKCKKAFEDSQQRFTDAFKGVGTTALSALQENLTGMRALREQLSTSSVVGQMLESENARIRWLKEAIGGPKVGDVAADVLKSLAPTEGISSIVQREPFNIGSAIREAHLGPIAASKKMGEAQPKQLNIHTTPPFIVPKFEETPGGRAALRAAKAMEKSAEELQQVTGYVGVMSSRLSELHELVVTEVMPKWVENLKESAESTQKSFSVSLFGVKVALWTAAASAFIACALTAWQLWIARDYKIENDKQQDRIELLLQEQLKSSQKLNQILGTELAKTRDELARLNKANAVKPVSSR